MYNFLTHLFHYVYQKKTNDRLWRKNTNPNLSVDGDCIGVDLNRNYDIEWMKSGSSDKPCAVTYAGTYPFSEPESKSHSIHMQTVRNPVAYLTYHAYSEFIIYPYSSSFEMEAYNKADLAAVAQKMQAAIKVFRIKNIFNPLTPFDYLKAKKFREPKRRRNNIVYRPT